MCFATLGMYISTASIKQFSWRRRRGHHSCWSGKLLEIVRQYPKSQKHSKPAYFLGNHSKHRSDLRHSGLSRCMRQLYGEEVSESMAWVRRYEMGMTWFVGRRNSEGGQKEEGDSDSFVEHGSEVVVKIRTVWIWILLDKRPCLVDLYTNPSEQGISALGELGTLKSARLIFGAMYQI